LDNLIFHIVFTILFAVANFVFVRLFSIGWDLFFRDRRHIFMKTIVHMETSDIE